jgi:flagellar biosynthesis/type III secretory pathway protein FliH
MTFHLFLDPQTPALAQSASLIKARDRADFEEAVTLLAEVRAMRAAAGADIEAAHADAEARGYADGLATAEARIEAMLTAVTAQFERFSAERRDDIATAAFAAVRAIIGDLEDESIAAGLVEASLSRIDSEGPVAVDVSPDMASRVALAVGHRPSVTVRGNDALGPHDCHIYAPQGRIVADLSIQMRALAERWGVAATDDTAKIGDAA